MSGFLRKSGTKVSLATACILLFALFLVSGFLSLFLLVAQNTGGDFGNHRDAFRLAVSNHMYRDASDIMNCYFDPADPSHPWKSYYSGSYYTGEDSNLRYTISDAATGATVLSTYEGQSYYLSQKSTHSFSIYDSTIEEEPEEISYTLDDTLFFCDGEVFLLNNEGDAFEPVEPNLADRLVWNYEFDSDLKDGVLYFEGKSFFYDGDSFTREKTEQTETVSVTQTDKTYTITCYIISGLEAGDIYRDCYNWTYTLCVYRYEVVGTAIVSLLLGLVLLVLLCCAAGRKPEGDAPYLSPLHRIPFDLTLVADFIWISCGIGMFYEVRLFNSLLPLLLLGVLAALSFSLLGVYTLVTLCVRVKNHSLLSTTICYWCWNVVKKWGKRVFRFCTSCIRKLPLIWKVAVCYCGLCFLEFIGILMFGQDDTLVFVWFVEKVLLALAVGYVALSFLRLKNGAGQISRGDYTPVSDEHLVLDFKDTADTLNHISDGMNAALESRMKSERLKTELITNVSHDIKTPLTSIVSYVDLLKKEPAGSEAAAEYLEVLDRQSARLKKLVEDLVEASKASTGNIHVNRERLDLTTILSQAMGEYAERLTAAALTPVMHLPGEPVMVEADGRLLWRVFDNLLGNVKKYAMPGTRVYVSVHTDTQAAVTFRNISRDPLDISADELMERFVRGDASRH
ncbi:MAG: HAMP domain-containing sensor histidine kinase, partial [Oscillospiraceae bacterium]|nr:HAMP domain-containing sensor histidine kinase [Oscillospiraceae bacterium]